MAFLLDTVTVSEFRRGTRADPSVIGWQQSISESQTYLSVITLNEIRYGILMVRKRDTKFAALLEKWYALIVAQSERFPVLNIDRTIAEAAADLRYQHKMGYDDSLIAATAEIHGLTLATRNIDDFESTGVALVNPWSFIES
jgi:predicted nucleic acid-binding protein